ncbi:MAG TPA: ROK family protein [Streptosporangiaceae bacterium]|nr:ROK family protein [Streptosporangiaceae bacterium]
MVATTSAQPAEPAEAPGTPVPAGPDTAEVADAALAQLGQLRPGQAARPQLLRALNEQLLLRHIRQLGRCSRAELARLSGLSKPTVSLALANVERSGLVREAGQRTGVPGRSAVLYEIRPQAGYVLGLDIGHQYLRGAVADLTGEVIARSAVRTRASSTSGRVAELIGLADELCADAGITRSAVTQTVIGTPGVYDPRRNAIALAGVLAGWGKPAVLADLRAAFGEQLVVENDVDAASLAEREHGHGREVRTFAFVWIGTGIGMGLVIEGNLHRGVHGVAGEIAYMPISAGQGSDPEDARRRGTLEAAGSAAAVVRAARRSGMRGSVSARRVFEAAAAGDERAAAVVADEAALVARAVCAIVTVVDPELVVLGGGIGQAPGFAAAVAAELPKLAPVLPEVRVSALGTEAVVDGCLASGAELAWQRLTALLP